MKKRGYISAAVVCLSATLLLSATVSADEEPDEEAIRETTHLKISEEPILSLPDEFPRQFTYDSLVDIDYPESGVKGIFLTGGAATGESLNQLTGLLNSTELNSMVIDVKDDDGTIVMNLDSDHEYVAEFTRDYVDGEALMHHLEEHDIYPIARIVVFKDSRLANARPDLSFTEDKGEVWSNRAGASFVNPYEREVWEYNVEVAKQAAALGFKDIQFDYVRFPEGFGYMDEQLDYSRGEYGESDSDNVQQRVDAVTDFVAFARQELQAYDVDVSVDIFGYSALVREEPNIGQSFTRISENVDVISSMIYPSHWGPGNLGIARPDLEPYNLVYNYMDVENAVLAELGEDAPRTRPWIQDFTASYLGAGNYMQYGDHEVSEQIRALHEQGVEEYLLWNAASNYSEGATFDFND
ncbi:MAG: putative glycoside hydrolase [Alkalibacterium sp.]|nr:putative glycoside hydrolase [Alkalibacterium sp.]